VQATLISDLQAQKISKQERQWLTNPFLGGLILFSRHFENKQQLTDLVSEIKSINSRLLITVDHEGGRVQRFRQGFTHVPAMGKLGQLWQYDSVRAAQLAYDSAVVLCYELAEVGIDLTYAPVLDIDYGHNQVVGDRSFSSDSTVLMNLVKQFLAGQKQLGFASVGKHFPGHGWVDLDSHVACPEDNRSLAEIEQADLACFQGLLPQLDWVMPAHVIYKQVDDKPAGFSSIWINQILRQQMRFLGPVVSDDLSMQAAAAIGDYAKRGQAALSAGCNVLLACNEQAAPLELLDFLENNASEPLDLSIYQPKIALHEDNKQAYVQSKNRIKEYINEF